MKYSLNYNKRKSRMFDGAAELRSNNIDSSIDNKEWLLYDPITVNKIDGVTYCFTNWKSDIQSKLRTECIEKNIPYMIDEPCQSWEYLYFLIEIAKVSQVRIGGELGFDLVRVSKYCKQHNVKIRLQDPNIPSFIFTEINAFKTFFIIPQWIKDIEEYIDIIEFTNPIKEIGLLGSYIGLGKWIGDMGLLTENIISGIDSMTLPKNLGERRARCQRSCFKGGSCRLCDKALDLAKTLKERNLIYE